MGKYVKSINGLKLIKRYSASAFISSLFCFAIVAAVVLAVYLPFLSIEHEGTTLTQNAKTIVLALFNKSFILFDAKIESISSLEGFSYIKMVYQIGNIVAGICYLIAAFLGVIMLLDGLSFLFRGRLTNHRVPVAIGWVMTFLCFLPYAGYAYGMEFILKQALTKHSINMNVTGVWPLTLLGAIFVASLFLNIIYTASFKNRIYVGDAYEFQHKEVATAAPIEEKPVKPVVKEEKTPIIPISEPSIPETEEVPLTKKASVLPSDIASIGGHAFAENLQLEVAIIPEHIKTLGISAFANCVNLKLVSLPKNLSKISSNCFFNCASLKRINYAGSKEEWRHIVRGSNWLTKAGTLQVNCIDGAILVDPSR